MNEKQHRRGVTSGSTRHIVIGALVSLLVNGAVFALAPLWLGSGGPLSQQPSNTVEVSLRPEPRPAPVKATPRPTPSPTPTPVSPPTPSATPTPAATPTPTATPTPVPRRVNPTPPPSLVAAKPAPRRTTVRAEGAHNHVIVRRAARNEPSTPQDFTARTGGNARAGQVMAQQSAGNATVAPEGPTAPVKPVATPEPTPVAAPAAKIVEAPRPTPTPEPTPTPAPPKITGPTRDAEPSSTVKPRIPDALKQSGFKGFVRVKVQVHADGTFDPVLRTSSGNPDVDGRILDALKQWRWKPKLVNGVPQDSTELFKFEIDVS